MPSPGPTGTAPSSSSSRPTPPCCPISWSGWRGASRWGLARNGSISSNGSGDIFVAFSTANREAASEDAPAADARVLANGRLNPLFAATVEATEEAIINALVAAETMTGANDVTVHALPHDRLREVLRKYGRLN